MTNIEFAKEMQARTKQFALRVIRMFQRLPKADEARVLGKQVLRSGTSVAANYRAACRAKSRSDFISKLGTTVEEADETLFWLELLEEAQIVASDRLEPLKHEADEILRVLSTSLSTAKAGR